jgi:chromosome segregation protein
MFLKSIEINGFKSFAQKTTLEFIPPQNGRNSLTVVVGPNGSGKSNVSDAIRWVMGEQRLKHLRGKKSEDVIFSGSDSKGQMGMASVVMTLDNSDKRAAIEYDELIIARKLYRNGDSEYSINGNIVRLLDIHLLLAKAQFGQGSYAVIGQGMIDRLILQSPQERKSFFDEAAGIKEFQIKRHQASLRLARTKEHVDQASLLLNEISPRLKTLSRQVKKLEARQGVELQLRELQEQYYTTLWQHHTGEAEILESGIKELSDALGIAQEQLQTIQTELANLAHASSRHQIFAELQQQYQEVVTKKNGMERERAVLLGKLQTEYAKSGNHQVGWLETKVVELQQEQEQFQKTITSIETSIASLKQDIQTRQQKVDEGIFARTALRGSLSTLESTLIQMKSEQSAFHITGFRAVQAVLGARRELPGVHGVVAQLGDVQKEHILALDVAAGGRLASLVVDDEDTARSGINYLREGKFGVATFLPLTKIRPNNTPHFVYELLDRPGVIGMAQELVQFDPKFEHIFSFVFGSTIVVEDFDAAKSLGVGRVRMVTLQGDLFETSGAVKGGHRHVRQHGISFSSGEGSYKIKEQAEEQEKRITEKKQELFLFEQSHEASLEELRNQQAALQNAEQKLSLYAEQKHGVDTELASLERELAMQTMSPEELGDVMKEITVSKESIDTDIVLIEKEIKLIAAKIEQFNDEEEKKKQRVFALQESMQVKQQEVNMLVADKNEKQVAFAKVETKLEDLQHELYQEMQSAIDAILVRGVEALQIDDLEVVQVNIQKMKYKLSLIGGIDEEVIEEYNQTKERHGDLSGQLDDLSKAITDLEKLIAELDAIMKKKRGKAFKQIKKEFARYFSILFEGGKADLVEMYEVPAVRSEQIEEDPLSEEISGEEAEEEVIDKRKKKILTGVDITACPPGKKIKHVRALSGGERTMTSIALMCAILKTNPSPFVVLDEVEAALDEANTLKIINILKELSEQSQFIMISHNRATMHAADALYGVTMGNDGVSHLLSVKMDEGVT